MPAPTFFDALNMSRSLNGLTPLQVVGGAAFAGYANANNLGFAETVVGGSALMLGVPLAFKGAKGLVWDAPKWAYKNYGNYGEAFKDAKSKWLETNFGANVRAQRQFFTNGVKGNGFFGGFRNAYNITRLQELEKAIPTDVRTGVNLSKYLELRKAGKLEEAKAYLKKFKDAEAAKIAKVQVYKTAQDKVKTIRDGIKNGTLKGKDLQKAVAELDRAIAEADKAALSINVKPTSRLGKIKAGLSKYTGAKAVNEALTKGAAFQVGGNASKTAKAGAKAVRGASKAAKSFIKGGGALTAAIEFGIEVPEIVKTFRECGSGAGLKQVGKSATVAVASGAGYVAGAWAGAKIGAAIGTCIGGPIGTFVGGAIGVVCGLAGSWLCSKGAKAVVGKSELEKKNEKVALQTTIEAYNDPKKMEELVNAYDQMIAQRKQMVDESVDESSIQEDTNVAQSEIDAQLAGLHFNSIA